jgi:hypothetical protein
MQQIKYSNESFDQNADPISSLPTNKSVPSYNEIKLIDTLFKNEPIALGNIVKEFKDSVMMCLAFIIMSLPQIDDAIKKFIPATVNPYILLISKGIIFGILFWLIKNFGLIKKD